MRTGPIRSAPRRRLGDRGAIMVMGVFMAAFLVGLLYFAMGTAEAILARERMQDAADAGAYSAAVVHARGMNIIALINLVMAAVLAVLIALKVTETCLLIGIALAAALSLCAGTGGIVRQLIEARDTVRQTYADVRPVVLGILEAGHRAQAAVRVAAPAAAQAKALQTVLAAYAPPVQSAFVWPARAELPVEDGCFTELCDRAGRIVEELTPLGDVPFIGSVAFPLVLVPGGSLIASDLGGTGAIARTFSAWFCGVPGSGSCAAPPPADPPELVYEMKICLPETDEARRCRTDPAAHLGDCEAVADQEDDACLDRDSLTGLCTRRDDDPDASTGACPSARCDARAARAQVQCEPRAGASDYVWQECEMLAHPPPQPPTALSCALRATEEPPPCGSPGWTGWSAAGSPICREAGAPGMTLVRYRAVTRVFSCRRREDLTVVMDDRLGVPGDGGELAHQRMQDGPEYDLGASGLQLKVVVEGELANLFDEGVRIAAWNRDAEGASDRLRALGRVGIAQAEFYYDCESASSCERDRWLWHMRWRARLRRFHLEPADGRAEDACAIHGGASCAGAALLDDVLGGTGKDLVLH